MKLYDFASAPNPRRVRMFAAEKNMKLELVPCDLAGGEHKTPEFLAMNPSGKVPVLELDDGRCISESTAICRYLEALRPEPNLMGKDAYELGQIECRDRKLELELWSQIGTSWINGPVVAKMGGKAQIPAAKEASDRNVNKYYAKLNDQLASTQFMVAGRFTIADITLLTAIDFATALVALKPDEGLTHLNRWYEEVSARSSAKA